MKRNYLILLLTALFTILVGTGIIISVYGYSIFWLKSNELKLGSAGEEAVTTQTVVTDSASLPANAVAFSDGTFLIGDSSNLVFDNANDRLGVGTSTPWGSLSVEIPDVSDERSAAFVVGDLGTSTPALAVYSSGITTIEQLQTGAISFDENGGMVSAMDMPVNLTQADLTVEGYNFLIDASTTLTVYAEANADGGIWNQRVGIGTSTPGATFSIQTSTTSQYAILIDGDSGRDFVIDGTGLMGISTSTPKKNLDIGTGLATSTIVIRGGGAVGGELILKDSDGNGCTMITVNDGNINSGDVPCP